MLCKVVTPTSITLLLLYQARTDTWEPVAVLTGLHGYGQVAWHTRLPQLVTSGARYEDIALYQLDLPLLLKRPASPDTVHYKSAKIVLVGESGVGKSGLALRLTGQPYAPTDSTHGRHIWPLAAQEAALPHGRREQRETWLWDLAGQAGYRLIHQLHLHEASVALVVFDGHSEIDPLAGIDHWVRALEIAQRLRPSGCPLKKLLIMAHIDRSGARVSRRRIEAIVQKHGFDGYFETSAKEGDGIAALQEAISKAILWEQLPHVSSTQLFQQIRTFLQHEQQSGYLLATVDELQRVFLASQPPTARASLSAQEFTVGLGHVAAAGFLHRLSFGGYVLLQPERLDAYASALIHAARSEPDELGSILEERVRAADFSLPLQERIVDREQERLLLIAMVEDVLTHELALREQGGDGPYLVFPSETIRENPTLPDPEQVSLVFSFAGPLSSIYATLAVRLSHSNLFRKQALWRNAITFRASVGGTCGLIFKTLSDGLGSLTLFFDAAASEQTRFHFEEYIHQHLQRRALPESIQRKRTFACTCGFVATDFLIRKRRDEQKLNWFDCPVCGTKVSLLDREERLSAPHLSRLREMDRAADEQRDRAVAQSMLQGKQEAQAFDVFLCHHEQEKPAVKRIGEQLMQQGILPWLDE